MKTGQIYVIKNNNNDKLYVGQTTIDYKERFKQHLRRSNDLTKKYKLYNAMRKYGKDSFYVELLEDKVPDYLLDKKEIMYIEKFDSYNNGYNSTTGGDGRVINKKYDENDIIQLYQKGESCIKIGEKYNVSQTTISRVLSKNNIKTRHDGNKYEGFNLEEFNNMWFDRKCTIKEMSKFFNVNEKTIRRFAKKIGLQKKRSVTTIEK